MLLAHLPFDVILDVGVVDVDDDHLGRAPRRAARLDRARRAVADLEEGHEAGGFAAARELLVLAAQLREIGAGARAIFEQARLAHPEIHDAALVDEIVGDGLDEAGVRLRMLIGRQRLDELLRLRIDVEMALARAVDAIGPVEAGVEPLRRIGRGDLLRQHVAQFVEERLRVGLRIEIRRPSSPNRSRFRRGGRTLGEPRFPRHSARPWAAPRARLRPARSARGTKERRFPRSASGGRGRRPCGNISAPERRTRPGSRRPEPRCPRARRRPIRRDCGFRCLSRETGSPHRGTGLPGCSGARSACSCPRNSLPLDIVAERLRCRKCRTHLIKRQTKNLRSSQQRRPCGELSFR